MIIHRHSKLGVTRAATANIDHGFIYHALYFLLVCCIWSPTLDPDLTLVQFAKTCVGIALLMYGYGLTREKPNYT